MEGIVLAGLLIGIYFVIRYRHDIVDFVKRKLGR